MTIALADQESFDETLARLSVRRDIPRPPQVSTADHIAAVLSQAILEGSLPPGTQLSEERVGAALGVSRNTLREGFRLLSHDGLLTHHRHRGVFVPQLTEPDLREIYELRSALELGVLRSIDAISEEQVDALDAIVKTGEEAARRGRWRAAGTANMDFHQQLMCLSGNARLIVVSRQVLAQMRLAFLSLEQPHVLHRSFVARNRKLITMLRAGDLSGAAVELEAYLQDSRDQLLDLMGVSGPLNR